MVESLRASNGVGSGAGGGETREVLVPRIQQLSKRLREAMRATASKFESEIEGRDSEDSFRATGSSEIHPRHQKVGSVLNDVAADAQFRERRMELEGALVSASPAAFGDVSGTLSEIIGSSTGDDDSLESLWPEENPRDAGGTPVPHPRDVLTVGKAFELLGFVPTLREQQEERTVATDVEGYTKVHDDAVIARPPLTPPREDRAPRASDRMCKLRAVRKVVMCRRGQISRETDNVRQRCNEVASQLEALRAANAEPRDYGDDVHVNRMIAQNSLSSRPLFLTGRISREQSKNINAHPCCLGRKSGRADADGSAQDGWQDSTFYYKTLSSLHRKLKMKAAMMALRGESAVSSVRQRLVADMSFRDSKLVLERFFEALRTAVAETGARARAADRHYDVRFRRCLKLGCRAWAAWAARSGERNHLLCVGLRAYERILKQAALRQWKALRIVVRERASRNRLQAIYSRLRTKLMVLHHWYCHAKRTKILKENIQMRLMSLGGQQAGVGRRPQPIRSYSSATAHDEAIVRLQDILQPHYRDMIDLRARLGHARQAHGHFRFHADDSHVRWASSMAPSVAMAYRWARDGDEMHLLKRMRLARRDPRGGSHPSWGRAQSRREHASEGRCDGDEVDARVPGKSDQEHSAATQWQSLPEHAHKDDTVGYDTRLSFDGNDKDDDDKEEEEEEGMPRENETHQSCRNEGDIGLIVALKTEEGPSSSGRDRGGEVDAQSDPSSDELPLHTPTDHRHLPDNDIILMLDDSASEGGDESSSNRMRSGTATEDAIERGAASSPSLRAGVSEDESEAHCGAQREDGTSVANSRCTTVAAITNMEMTLLSSVDMEVADGDVSSRIVTKEGDESVAFGSTSAGGSNEDSCGGTPVCDGLRGTDKTSSVGDVTEQIIESSRIPTSPTELCIHRVPTCEPDAKPKTLEKHAVSNELHHEPIVDTLEPVCVTGAHRGDDNVPVGTEADQPCEIVCPSDGEDITMEPPGGASSSIRESVDAMKTEWRLGRLLASSDSRRISVARAASVAAVEAIETTIETDQMHPAPVRSVVDRSLAQIASSIWTNRLKRRAFGQWRHEAAPRKALTLRARLFAASSCLHRAFLHWRGHLLAGTECARKGHARSLKRRAVSGWLSHMRFRARLLAFIIRTSTSNGLRLQSRMLLAWHSYVSRVRSILLFATARGRRVLSGAFFAWRAEELEYRCARPFFTRWLHARCLSAWRRWASNRRLLRRVFASCVRAWEDRMDEVSYLYAEDMGLALAWDTFKQWQRSARVTTAKRAELNKCKIACEWRRRRLLAHAFAAFRGAIGAAIKERRAEQEAVAMHMRKLLRRWRTIVVTSCPAGAETRTALRVAGYYSEFAYWRKMTQRKVVLSWCEHAFRVKASVRLYFGTRRCRVVMFAWKMYLRRRMALYTQHYLKWEIRMPMQRLFMQWRHVIEEKQRHMALTFRARRFHEERIMHSVLCDWVREVSLIRFERVQEETRRRSDAEASTRRFLRKVMYGWLAYASREEEQQIPSDGVPGLGMADSDDKANIDPTSGHHGDCGMSASFSRGQCRAPFDPEGAARRGSDVSDGGGQGGDSHFVRRCQEQQSGGKAAPTTAGGDGLQSNRLIDRVKGRQLVARAFAAWILYQRYGSRVEGPEGVPVARVPVVEKADDRDSIEVRDLVDKLRGEADVERRRLPSLTLVAHTANACVASVRQSRHRSALRRSDADVDPILALRHRCSSNGPIVSQTTHIGDELVPHCVVETLNEIREQWR